MRSTPAPLTGYAIVPAYTATLARQGYGQAASATVEAWRAGDRGRAVDLFSDEMVDAFFVQGDVRECRERLAAYEEAGVRTAILMHLSVSPTAEERALRIAEQLEALAPAVPG